MTEGQVLDFPPSFYARIPVEQVSLGEMDRALAAGYYRNGSELCSTSARFFNQKWVSSVMLRLPLAGFAFKKRHRKLLTTNNLRFRHHFRRFQPTPEMEALWQRYKSTVHKWATIHPIDQHLLRGLPASSFNMWELCVFDGEKLVAFTAFDLGETCIASLEAAYDPAYGSHSLGFYTMLLEIQFCQENSLAHYYPGFLPKDVPMFKYKLRPGEMAFFSLKKAEWLPFAAIKEADWLMDEVFDRLSALKERLAAARFEVVEGFGHCLHLPHPSPQITDSNVHLVVLVRVGEGFSLLFVTWDAVAGAYRAFQGMAVLPELPSPLRPAHFYYRVGQQQYFGEFGHAAEVVALAQNCQTSTAAILSA